MNETKIKHGVIHVHSENSLKDSAIRVDDICKRAAELGAPAITLTDHGTLTGIEEFLVAAKKYGIKPIPGVEAYYEEDDELSQRAHLILLAKDSVGYHAICKAVTDSNRRLDSQGIPRMNLEILNNYFGEGSRGHGHVIATTACVSGILSVILLENKRFEKEIEKLVKKQKVLRNPNSKQYAVLRGKIQEMENDISSMTQKINELKAIAKKPYTKKLKALKSLEGKPEYDERKAILDAEMLESKNAVTEAEVLAKEKNALKAKQKGIKETAAIEEKDHERWNNIDNQIKKIKNAQSSEDVLFEKATEQAKTFMKIFGEGNFYVELQNHRMPEEKLVMSLAAKIASSLGIPVVAANDVHVLDNTEDSLKARQIMRSLRFNKWEERNETDNELYIKTDEELASILSEILPEEIVKKAMQGIGDVVAACDYKPEIGSHYPKYVSEISGETADEALRRMAYEGIEWRYPGKEGWTEEYEKRLEYELGVIAKMGYSDYHCIVRDFLEYGRLLGLIDLNDPRFLADPYNIPLLKELGKGNVGCGVGPGRGSAVGSLVCYLAGITSVDPIKYNLLFERFLNVERVSMPDIGATRS